MCEVKPAAQGALVDPHLSPTRFPYLFDLGVGTVLVVDDLVAAVAVDAGAVDDAA